MDYSKDTARFKFAAGLMVSFDIVTLFPNQIESFTREGLLRIAIEKRLIDIRVHNLRDWTSDIHKTVDDKPYGGGAGMVLKVEPVALAIESLKKDNTKVILPTPRGEVFTQIVAKRLYAETGSKNVDFIFLAGHYEGFDERVHEHFVDYEISMGDFILSGGELPALTMIDAITRLIPGALGNADSAKDESFENNTLEYPQYTRPENYNGWKVPSVLLSGHHAEVDNWRKEQSKLITRKRRPDLIDE